MQAKNKYKLHSKLVSFNVIGFNDHYDVSEVTIIINSCSSNKQPVSKSCFWKKPFFASISNTGHDT